MSAEYSKPKFDTSYSLDVVKNGLPQGEEMNDHTDIVALTPEERVVGAATYKIFTTRLVRPTPWTVKGNDILVPPAKANVIQRKYGDKLKYREKNSLQSNGWIVISDGLENEGISDFLRRDTEEFKLTEDYLEDFMSAAYMFRNYTGIAKGYTQWGREELNHSMAASVELIKTGNKTDGEVIGDMQNALGHTWEPPFKTARKVALYTTFQEKQTGEAYFALAAQAEKEEAFTVQAINEELIGPDEIYHGGGFEKYVREFYKFDPEGTTRDAIEVALNYRMPILNLHPDPRQAFRDSWKLGIQRSEFVAEKIIEPVLLEFGFIAPEVAHQVARAYADGRRNIKQ